MATQVTTAETTIRTNHEPSSTAWFWWKESRQLAPLLVMLVAVALLMLFFDFVGDSLLNIKIPKDAMLLAIPGLFATGAGPLLVGQERAQRTIEWLTLLPISPLRMAVTKFLVSLAGLAIMWAFFFLMKAILHGTSPWNLGFPQGQHQGGGSGPVWLIHSLFVLLVGFYVSWRLENQFYALLLLIVIAFSPFISVALTSELIGRPFLARESDWWSFLFTSAGVCVMLPLSLRAASRTLGAKPAPKIKSLELGRSSATAASVPRFETQVAPIIWQSLHSARGTWLVIAAMFVLGGFAMVEISDGSPRGTATAVVPFLILIAAVAVSWLGVCVFKHDGSSERLRFLADRGVSWQRAYIALHGIPIAILSTVLLIYAFWNMKVQHWGWDGANGSPSLVTMLFFTAMAYSVSQWISQIFRTLILSVIIAPILAWAAVGWVCSMFVSGGFPVWGMLVCLVAPMVASFGMMNRYMDGRDRPWTFLVGAGVIATIIGLPVFTAYSYVMSIPAMTAQQHRDLLSEARLVEMSEAPEVYLDIDFNRDYLEQHLMVSAESLIKQAESFEYRPEKIVEPLNVQPGEQMRAGFTNGNFERWYGLFTLSRQTWEADPSTWSEFAVWLESSAKLLKSMRASSFMTSQEWADRLEVMLLDVLASEAIREQQNADAVQAVVASIGTPESRAEARRRSVLLAWGRSVWDPDNYQQPFRTGFYEEKYAALVNWSQPRREQAVVLTLLDGIEASKRRSNDIQWLRKLHQLVDSTIAFEASNYSPSVRSTPAIRLLDLNSYGNFAPSRLWGLDWEYQDPRALLTGDVVSTKLNADSPAKPNTNGQE
ncbi:hypothetical protein LOC67_08555 [Stieleria sp. JC731]|uniref:hypothetical protein n=1 Tax=Pirellulaceae TaxID=2691357 RepID=UPI001E4D4B39|nr:hypothetical protein [Stieleria sp. JC731]MCC9600610.1 hypothetical protein [Stieleria sp. JC731]